LSRKLTARMMPTQIRDGRFPEDPTDEQLANIIALGDQQMQLRETRELYLRLLDSLEKDFNFAQEGDSFRGKGIGCQHVGCTKTSATCSYEAPENKKQNQSAAATSVGDSEESLAHVFSPSGSDFGDLPQHFQFLIFPSDARPGKGPEALDFKPCTNDANTSWNTNGMQMTKYNAAGGEAHASAAFCTAQASSSNTLFAECSTGTMCRFSQATQSNLMVMPPGNFNFDHHNSLLPRSLPCAPIQQNAQHLLMGSTLCPTSMSGNNHYLAPCHARSQDQEVTSGNSSRDLVEATETQVQREAASEGRRTSPQRTETQGTFFDASIPVSNIDVGLSYGTCGPTTLVVRNIPLGCTKEMLLQTWPPDGSFDFLYLPYSFKDRRIAGYVFLNFTSQTAAFRFHSWWHGQFLPGQCSSAKLNVSTAPVQGLEANVRHLVQCKIRRIKNPKYLPSVFDGLQEVPFSELIKNLE